MSETINIRPHDLEIVRAILATYLPPESRVWVFGSRVNGRTRRSSDLDLLVDAGHELTLSEAGDLSCAFEESDLPYKVDVVDRRGISDSFRAALEGRPMVVLPFRSVDGVAER